MIEISFIIAVLIAHWIGDFIFQSDYHAVNKSKSNAILMSHVLMYTAAIYWVGFFFLPIELAFAWAVANAILHFITDYFTSRLTTILWTKGDRHNFFVTIGADQTIHMISLFGSYVLLKGLV
jgi:hypothetical protein